MMHRTEVLDYGYVELVESWGSDEGIIEAARMSTGKGFLGWGPKVVPNSEPDGPNSIEVPGDEKLLRYLYEHKHSTPFEMAGMTIEVQAPIFVFRQWHRHRTQSYNEMSARYTPLPDVDYVPTVERMLANSTVNKQAGKAQGASELSSSTAWFLRQDMQDHYADCERRYQRMLREGVPKELARLVLPVARYSRMRASANLRNWLAFLTLRMDSHAQYEIRVYAAAVGSMIAHEFPRTWELFIEGKGKH